MAATQFKLSTFTTKLASGGARPNLFRLSITSLPSVALKRNGLNDWQYLCKATNIPSSTINTIEVPYLGRTVKVAGDREFTELSTTIINDETMQLRQIIDSWMHGMNKHADNVPSVNLGNRTTYTGTLKLQTFTKQAEVDQEWEFLGCWPSLSSAIDLNWDSANAIEDFTVTWQYDYYIHKKANITAQN